MDAGYMETVLNYKKLQLPTVVPTSCVLGAEILGVDLSQELDDESFSIIDSAFDEFSVIFFRNQTLSPEAQINFTKRFGDIEINPNTQYALEDYPEILLVANIEKDEKPIGLSDAGRFWHTDMSYTKRPPRCSILHAIEVPIENNKPLGDTLFASTAAAYDKLTNDLKNKIDGLKAIHSFKSKKRVPHSKRDDVTKNNQKQYPNVVHPVARTHPTRGNKCIYVSSDECIGIEDMPDEDAITLIQYLSEHCIQERFIYRHKWQVGDVLMWDNCAAQHKAIEDYQLPQVRLMHRTTVNGTAPY
jgi:taurine dioxygenase